jgi:hypothetical protein
MPRILKKKASLRKKTALWQFLHCHNAQSAPVSGKFFFKVNLNPVIFEASGVSKLKKKQNFCFGANQRNSSKWQAHDEAQICF